MARRPYSLPQRPVPTHRPALWAGLGSVYVAAVLALAAPGAHAQTAGGGAEIFKGADLKLGEQLMKEHKCAACHVSKVGGDGTGIYRPLGTINNAGLLRGMVEMCNTNLNLQMFPEDVTAAAAVLNRDHYKFREGP
jgi:hypothetical protein